MLVEASRHQSQNNSRNEFVSVSRIYSKTNTNRLNLPTLRVSSLDQKMLFGKLPKQELSISKSEFLNEDAWHDSRNDKKNKLE